MLYTHLEIGVKLRVVKYANKSLLQSLGIVAKVMIVPLIQNVGSDVLKRFAPE